MIPQEDAPALSAAGVSRVFLSGTTIAEIASYLQETVGRRLGTT